MRTFRVQLWADKAPNGYRPEPYAAIEARSDKEAAELLHGGPLVEVGSLYKLRARVRSDMLKAPVTAFYEP